MLKQLLKFLKEKVLDLQEYRKQIEERGILPEAAIKGDYEVDNLDTDEIQEIEFLAGALAEVEDTVNKIAKLIIEYVKENKDDPLSYVPNLLIDIVEHVGDDVDDFTFHLQIHKFDRIVEDYEKEKKDRKNENDDDDFSPCI